MNCKNSKIFLLALNTAFETIHVNSSEGIETAEYHFTTGKAVNIAYFLSTMNYACKLYMICADEDKNEFAKIENEKVDVSIHTVPGKTRRIETNVCADGTEQKKIQFGYTVNSSDIDIIFDKILLDVSKDDIVFISGSLPLGAPTDTYYHIISELNKRQILVFFDSNGRGYLEGLKAKPFYIKPNQEELDTIICKQFYNDSELQEVIMEISKKYCIDYVVITLGQKGCIAYNKSDKHILYGYSNEKIKPKISSVGCGDAFNAGLLIAFLEQKSFEEQIISGNAAGLSVIKYGFPNLVSIENYEKLKQKIIIHSNNLNDPPKMVHRSTKH